MSKHLSKSAKVDIVNAYTTKLTPAIDLAQKHGITRQGIYKILKANGVDTSKRGPMAVSCTACGKQIERNRARIRHQKNHFCDMECYYSYLEASQGGEYVYSRQGQRVARSVVSKYFDLLDNHVVHHKDRNTLNNLPKNLMVFACQGDHIRYHRLGPDYVKPIWDGSNITG